MIRSFCIRLAVLITGLCIATASYAGTTHAILVGVGQTADPKIQPRKFAEADAQALYDMLVNPDYRGVPAENIHLLLSKDDPQRHAQPATKDNILAAAKAVVGKAAKDDMVIVAFFGRGANLPGDRTCFLTRDSTIKDRATTALATADLEQEFNAFKGDKLVAFIDINYKGIDPGEEKLLEPNPGDMLTAFFGHEEKDKEDHTIPPGRAAFLSNRRVSADIDLEKHGLFAQVLLDGLAGAADTDGYEPDGNVTVDELAPYLEKHVADLARKNGKTNDQKEQSVFFIVGYANHFTVTHNPAAMPKVKERLTKLAALDLNADLKAEGAKLLAKMPKLKADQALRKLYQQLADGTLSAATFNSSRADNFAGRTFAAEDAKTFARKTMQGFSVVKSGYIKELEFGEMAGWAIKGMYRRLEENVPADLKEKLDAVKELDRGGVEQLLVDVRTRLGKREDLQGYKDVDLAMSTMMSNLDYPYTTYIDKESVAKARIDFRGQFTGIGIQIRKDQVRDGLLCVSPIKDSPAYKAGLKAGDLITEIVTDMDAKGHEMAERETVSTKGMSTEDAIKRILGKAGTKITVKVEREGVAEPVVVDIRRAQVNVETVIGVKRNNDDSWEFMLDPKEKIGYIRLTQFIDNSSADMEAAVKKLEAQGMKGLVLDLRFNPGGLLDAAVEITDMFIDTGKIVTIRPRVGRERTYGGTPKENHNQTKFSLVCLVNGESASGSEIVAAALQDHSRATIIGARTYGKGSVQTIHPFRPTEAEIKMTQATYWRPSGKNINKPSTDGSESADWGVRPNDGFVLKLDRADRFSLFERLRDDEVIPRRDLPVKEKPPFKDRQLDMALEHLKSQIRLAAQPPVKKNG